jgi:hypothetical protein
MDEETYKEIKDAYPCRKVFSGRIRGRSTAMRIYGPLSSRQTEDAPPET